MDIEEDNTGYKRLLMNGTKLPFSVYALKNSPFKIATLCFGVLCAALVIGLIGQAAYYKGVGRNTQEKLEATKVEKDNLQENLKSVQNEKKNMVANHEQVQKNLDYMSKMKTKMETNNNLLTAETNQLKESKSQLQASNTALNNELEQLKTSKEQLQTNNNALSTGNDLLQQKYDSVVKSKMSLQANCDTVTKERDLLQNKFNNATRSKEKLQMSYNSLIIDIEHLQQRYNSSSSEKDDIASSHRNVTLEKDNLQAAYLTLSKAADKLLASYNSTIEEKRGLENSLKDASKERDQQKTVITNLTAEVEQLRATITELNTTKVKTCPSGWKKFETNCYYSSTFTKKTWYLSRSYCQGKGADLVIINSKDEMEFVNGMFTNNKEVWIGLNDQGVEGQWKWVDGTTLTTSYWADSQPNSYNGDQDCVEFWHRSSGKAEWNDEKCSSQRNWVCEK
ncbi:C-type lectin domain family 4 member G-like [Entelurus aequoreus]|uniref:C-type lectin domain family 4 member G-like n=1 Tax=Entelurus aequoreus TaxID=161455 RepID=UPI002B1D8346|nr:C-type lectin domain family 4 member G-like [Entelurus aequoreus]